MSQPWTEQHIPDQHGRVAVVTGANVGLGFETARMLAEHGARVVLAVRDIEKGRQAAARMGGDVGVQALDLTSLESVSTAAAELRATYPRIDLLINNAGVMYTPKQTTADGFELQFGTNHLGHFALTNLLLERLLPVPGSRVVTVSSTGHRIRAAIHFDDLQWERSYSRSAAYGQAKLANLMFTYELQRRLAPTARRSPSPPTPACPTPNSPGTHPRHCACPWDGWHHCSRRHPRWVRSPPSAPQRIPAYSAGSTTAPAAEARSADTRRSSPPAMPRTTMRYSSGCGPCRRNSPG